MATLAPAPDGDAFVLSYPKAGRTWLRAMIGKVLVDRHGFAEREIMDADKLTRRVHLPALVFDHDGSGMKSLVRWQDMPGDRSAYAGKRGLLLGRDVRDTLVSAYFQATRRIRVWRGPLAPFLRDDRLGVDKILAFYRIWWTNRHIPAQFLFLRYEELHADAPAALARALAFLGIEADPPDIATAVEYCRFDNLRRAEVEGRFDTGVLAARDPADLESYKVRKGKVGNFGEYMTAEDVAYVDAAIAARGCEFTRARAAA